MKPKLYVVEASPEEGKFTDWSKAVRMTFPNLGSARASRAAVDASSTASGKANREGAVGNARGRPCSPKNNAIK